MKPLHRELNGALAGQGNGPSARLPPARVDHGRRYRPRCPGQERQPLPVDRTGGLLPGPHSRKLQQMRAAGRGRVSVGTAVMSVIISTISTAGPEIRAGRSGAWLTGEPGRPEPRRGSGGSSPGATEASAPRARSPDRLHDGPLTLRPRKPPVLLVWNASASAPVGLTGSSRGCRSARRHGGCLDSRAGSSARGETSLLPANVPLVKQRRGRRRRPRLRGPQVISINGRPVAAREASDTRGRPMPWWNGCRNLRRQEYFLLMDRACHSTGATSE